jgi:hypothetical protein
MLLLAVGHFPSLCSAWKPTSCLICAGTISHSPGARTCALWLLLRCCEECADAVRVSAVLKYGAVVSVVVIDCACGCCKIAGSMQLL